MKNSVIKILVAILLFGTVAVSLTMARGAAGGAVPPLLGQSMLKGPIAEIDTTNATVSVESGIGEPLKFQVPATTAIVIPGVSNPKLSNLKVGDNVTVTYTCTTNSLTAVKIISASTGQPPAAAQPPKKKK